VRAVLKRSSKKGDNLSENELLEMGPITIDFNLKEVFINAKKISLTKTEFELFALLAQNPESMYSRENIINQIWQHTYVSERTVDVHIARLRKKLGDLGEVITNRVGYGYWFNQDKL